MSGDEQHAEAEDFGDAEDLILGAGRALLTCINHVRLTKAATASMRYQLELEDGSVESYNVEVKAAEPIVSPPTTKTLN
jgi:hypothetical protein